jgi:D-arabinose 1-dehydrogenase-like Zn-dependent alcohol dehydrogenase
VELPQDVPPAHALNATSTPPNEGGPASTPINAVSLKRTAHGFVGHVRAAVYNGPRSIEVADRPDPVATAPTVVGDGESVAAAFAIARPGSTVGIVGVPHDVQVPFESAFFRNIGWRGGAAPARVYIPDLLDDVLEGRINTGGVLDYETDLEGIADAYAAMDERRAIESLVRVGAR